MPPSVIWLFTKAVSKQTTTEKRHCYAAATCSSPSDYQLSVVLDTTSQGLFAGLAVSFTTSKRLLQVKEFIRTASQGGNTLGLHYGTEASLASSCELSLVTCRDNMAAHRPGANCVFTLSIVLQSKKL